MPTYRVTAEFDLTLPNPAAVQEMAHQWLVGATKGNQIVSDIATTPEEVADFSAQNMRWSVSILVREILAQGVEAVYPSATVGNLATNNNAPNGPV